MRISTKLQIAIELASNDPKAWANLCDVLADEFDGLGTVVLPLNRDRRLPWLVTSQNLIPVLTEYLSGGWSSNDVRENALPAGRARGYSLDSDVGTEQQVNALPYYRDLLRPHGIGGFCGILFQLGDAEWAMSVQLPLGTFVPPDEKLALIPEIRARIEDAALLCKTNVERLWESHFASNGFLESGMAVLGINGRIVRRNSKFSDIFANTSGEGEKVAFPDPMTRFWIDRFAAPGEAQLLPTPYFINTGGTVMACTIQKVSEDLRLFSSDDFAVVTITEHTDWEQNLSNVLISRFGLVLSEVQLVLKLCQGRNIKLIAKELGITEGTARQRLKTTFVKTDSQTQHQLVVNALHNAGLLPTR